MEAPPVEAPATAAAASRPAADRAPSPPSAAKAPARASAAAPAAAPAVVSAVVPAAVPPAAPAAASTPGERPIASPSVRRRARELGVELNDVKPSGSAGRIVHADVQAAAAARSAPAAESKPAPKTTPAPAARAESRGAARAEARDDEEAIPVIGLRRRIAVQMQESKRHIPHFSYVEEVDVSELEALRAALNKKWAVARGHLTLLPLLMRAMVLALRDFPQINARFDDEKGIVTRHSAVHLGIATQTAHGLLVPVVRHAQTLDLWAMSAEVARLADLARAGRATRAELMGSTITLTSLGALGGIVTTPIINRPEVGIVGVNRIVERAVFRAGVVVPRLTMNLSSSFDHRVIDGADAAQFIQAVRALLEQPALLFVE